MVLCSRYNNRKDLRNSEADTAILQSRSGLQLSDREIWKREKSNRESKRVKKNIRVNSEQRLKYQLVYFFSNIMVEITHSVHQSLQKEGMALD